MLFESHAHYDDEAFDTDREELLASMKDNNIEYIINVGASLKSTATSVELAQKYPFVYAAAGVHPNETAPLNVDNFEWLRQQCGKEKVVAIGEIGLDYYWDEPDREIQKYWFEKQLDLARELNKPIIIHSRDAAKDTMDIMMSEHAKGLTGVIHCFSYTYEMALDYVKMGYYIGIGGVITFKNGKKLREVVEKIPVERILLETDSPYLSPEPNRGKRNSSLNIPYIAGEIARIKGMTYEEVVDVTNKNSKRLFDIK